MSWQEYIDDHLLAPNDGGRQLAHAAIAGQSGDIWAQSPNFPELDPKECSAIMSGFDDQAALAQSGLYLGGQKYIVVMGDEGAVIRARNGSSGVTIKKTNSALVIGIYEPPMQAGEASIVVENLGDYLMEQGI